MIYINIIEIISVYQSASPIAQDISFQLRNKTRSFRFIFSKIVKDIPLVMKKGLRGSVYVVWSQRILNDLPLTVKKVINHLEKIHIVHPKKVSQLQPSPPFPYRKTNPTLGAHIVLMKLPGKVIRLEKQLLNKNNIYRYNIES